MSKQKPSARSTHPGVRIIGGHLRGSKLPVLDAPGLRPSPDRLRETLFNWLGPTIRGARVLDLYAGSGALGIEASSRGAAEVVLVERDRRLAASLRAQLARLKLDGSDPHLGSTTQLVEGDAAVFLARGCQQAFDLVLLDPPFAADLWASSMRALLQHGWLKDDGLIYAESPNQTLVAPPAAWVEVRHGKAGAVSGRLFRKQA